MHGMKYYVVKNPMGDGYIAKVKPLDRLKLEEIINEMIRIDNSLNRNDIKRIINTMIKACGNLLAEGNTLEIDGLVRIRPVIKGSFDAYDSAFNKKKNRHSLTSSLIKDFIKDYKNKASAVKTEKPSIHPALTYNINNKDKTGALSLDHANRLTGLYLKSSDHDLKGLRITDPSDSSNAIDIDKTGLDIIKHNNKELYFSLLRSFSPPSWLSAGKDVNIQILFTHKKNGRLRESSSYKTSVIT